VIVDPDWIVRRMIAAVMLAVFVIAAIMMLALQGSWR